MSDALPTEIQSPGPPEAPNTSQLDRHLVHGVAWTAAAKWMTQALVWASTIIVARLLSPTDFGIMGMATLYLGLIEIFSEFGFGAAIVTLRDLSAEQIAQINSVAVISGIVGVLLSAAVAAPLGRFFHEPRLPPVIVAMSATFLIAAFKTVPAALLQRDLRFKHLSVATTLQAVAQALATLVLAYLGFNYWALVTGNILGVLAGTLVCLRYAHAGFGFSHPSSIRHAVRYSWHVLVGRFCWYGYSNADFLVAGRVLGSAPLGAYTLAWNIANMPIERVTALVGQVTPTFFSAVQKDPALLRRYLRNLTEGIALITFPVCFGLALVAPELVHTLLGGKWDSAVPVLELLAAYASVRSISTLIPQVLYVVGESRFSMWIGVLALVVMPIVFFIGSHWGTYGIAFGWVIGYPIIVAPIYWRTFARIGMTAREYFRAIRAPLDASVLMIVAVVLVRHAPGFVSQRPKLAIEVLTGAIIYCLVLLQFHRKRLTAFYLALKSVREGAKTAWLDQLS